MKTVFTITYKELKDYFLSPLAYVFLIVFVLLVGWFFFSDFFIRAQASLRLMFNWVPVLFLVFLPAVTMGKWAEEKKSGTFEVLLTLPLKDWQVVFGKFLASFLFLLVSLALTLPLAVLVSFLGDLDWGPVMGGYVGFVLLGASCLAIGLFISSLTHNAIIAFIVSFVLLFALYLIGEPIVLNYLPLGIANFFTSLSLSHHFQSIARGLVDSRDLLYYLSMTGFFLYLNVLSLESRKWEG